MVKTVKVICQYSLCQGAKKQISPGSMEYNIMHIIIRKTLRYIFLIFSIIPAMAMPEN
jgi:hypothetical protein